MPIEEGTESCDIEVPLNQKHSAGQNKERERDRYRSAGSGERSREPSLHRGDRKRHQDYGDHSRPDQRFPAGGGFFSGFFLLTCFCFRFHAFRGGAVPNLSNPAADGVVRDLGLVVLSRKSVREQIYDSALHAVHFSYCPLNSGLTCGAAHASDIEPLFFHFQGSYQFRVMDILELNAKIAIMIQMKQSILRDINNDSECEK